MNKQGTLILLCGLPGAGKSTLAARMAKERGAVWLSPDAWIEALLADLLDVAERDRLRDPVENLQWDHAQVLLAQGMTVILDNGFWAEEERSAYAAVALELGARIELYYLEVPFEELWRRVALRNEQLERPTFVMSRGDVEHWWPQFQPPTEEEMAFYDAWGVVK